MDISCYLSPIYFGDVFWGEGAQGHKNEDATCRDKPLLVTPAVNDDEGSHACQDKQVQA